MNNKKKLRTISKKENQIKIKKLKHRNKQTKVMLDRETNPTDLPDTRFLHTVIIDNIQTDQSQSPNATHLSESDPEEQKLWETHLSKLSYFRDDQRGAVITAQKLASNGFTLKQLKADEISREELKDIGILPGTALAIVSSWPPKETTQNVQNIQNFQSCVIMSNTQGSAGPCFGQNNSVTFVNTASDAPSGNYISYVGPNETVFMTNTKIVHRKNTPRSADVDDDYPFTARSPLTGKPEEELWMDHFSKLGYFRVFRSEFAAETARTLVKNGFTLKQLSERKISRDALEKILKPGTAAAVHTSWIHDK
jgi:hypothetical protein